MFIVNDFCIYNNVYNTCIVKVWIYISKIMKSLTWKKYLFKLKKIRIKESINPERYVKRIKLKSFWKEWSQTRGQLEISIKMSVYIESGDLFGNFLNFILLTNLFHFFLLRKRLPRSLWIFICQTFVIRSISW